jgi:hypothetical protein
MRHQSLPRVCRVLQGICCLCLLACPASAGRAGSLQDCQRQADECEHYGVMGCRQKFEECLGQPPKAADEEAEPDAGESQQPENDFTARSNPAADERQEQPKPPVPQCVCFGGTGNEEGLPYCLDNDLPGDGRRNEQRPRFQITWLGAKRYNAALHQDNNPHPCDPAVSGIVR